MKQKKFNRNGIETSKLTYKKQLTKIRKIILIFSVSNVKRNYDCFFSL
jgi:hypothetical protein